MILRSRTSKEYLERAPYVLGEHAFLFTLFLIACAVGISALVFFLSILSSNPTEIEMQAESIKLRTDVFEKILETRSGQDQKVRDSRSSFPKDIFRLGK